jgi:hypothetical protein
VNTRWSQRLTFVLIVAITVLGFGGWLAVMLFLWLGLQAAGLRTDFWAMTEALSTAAATAAVLGAAFVAYRELSELSNSRYLEVVDALFRELNAEENVEARRHIFKKLPDFPEEGKPDLTDEDRRYMKRVLNSLDHVAFLTQDNLVPEEMIMPWMNPMIVKSWAKLEPYVLYVRQSRDEPDYYEHAGRLAECCLVWRKEHLPNTEITWVRDTP